MLDVSDQLDTRLGGHAESCGARITHAAERSTDSSIDSISIRLCGRSIFPHRCRRNRAAARASSHLQALFTMNSPFVIDQAAVIVEGERSPNRKRSRANQYLFRTDPYTRSDVTRIAREHSSSNFSSDSRTQIVHPLGSSIHPWPLLAQALLMSNEFQYVD